MCQSLELDKLHSVEMEVGTKDATETKVNASFALIAQMSAHDSVKPVITPL